MENLQLSYQKFLESKLPTDQFIELFFSALESGVLAVANKENDEFVITPWIQQAIVSILKTLPCQSISQYKESFDKIPLQNASHQKRYRQLPGAIVRRGSHIGNNSIIMPSFINIGSYIGAGTMIDTWATVGSCAYVGENCHISGGVGLGGVLEPAGSRPVIIENDCFIGGRSEIAEGVHIGHHSVLASGVFLTASTKIYNRMTGQISTGHIPPYSVVVPGTLKIDDQASVSAAIIVKMRDRKTDKKVSLNEALRSTL